MVCPVTEIWVVRHGATLWSASGRHTGRTDIALSAEGEDAARRLAVRLAGVRADAVFASPLLRARRTAELAGFPDATVEPRAVEWDYGDHEGLTREQIRESIPGWTPWSFPAMPSGESLDDVATRARAVLDHLGGLGVRRVLLFAHGHFLRILATQHIGQLPVLAEHLALDPATISVLGSDRSTPVLQRWNT
jgi:broad specificity phosphatase PhoE